MQTADIHLVVNGMCCELEVEPHQTLLEILRDSLGLMGTKEGCGGEGECGACTVIFNGKAVTSCLILAIQADGGEVITIEGLAQDGSLDPVQEAFVENGAVQCGFCTPGMVMSAKALLMHNPGPSENEIREALAGNLCRCTGYAKIIKAVQSAALRQKSPAERSLR